MESRLFMSKSNLIANMLQFKRVVSYDVNAYADDNRLKKLFYSIMEEINRAHVGSRFRSETDRAEALNKVTLKVARDYFAKNFDASDTPPSVGLPFPKAVRNDPPMELPKSASGLDAFTYDRLRSNVHPDSPPPADPGLATVQEVAPGIAQTDDLLQQLQQTRQEQMETFRDVVEAAQHAQLVDELSSAALGGRATDAVLFSEPDAANDPESKASERHLFDGDMCKPESVQSKQHFVCVSAADRDVRLYPLRSSFRVQMLDPIRYVKKVRVMFVQVPMESNVNLRNQTVYERPLDIAFPYLLLTIDEVPPMYTGNNDSIRRTFSVLTYVRHCIMSNSRGYTTMSPQNEEYVYTTAPLPTLSTLTMSLRYPNGEPYTDARDDSKASQMDFIPQTNPSASEYGGLMRVALLAPVGANEYQTNDFVRLSSFDVDTGSMTSEQRTAIDTLNNYLTRPEGIRVIGVDVSNSFGRVQGILVKLPGNINASGVWQNDAGVLQLFDAVPIVQLRDTSIWNMSLQVSVCLQVTAEIPAWTNPPVTFG